MATLSEILTHKWRGAVWTLDGDDHKSLVWDDSNAEAKPSEEQIRAFSTDVDQLIAAEQKAEQRQDAILTGHDPLFRMLDAVVGAVADLQEKADPEPAHRDRIAAIKAEIDGVKARAVR